jgi:GGDEF domain-containing protein
MDMAYATGEEAFLAPGAARRSQLLGSLYTSLLPAVDAQLGYLQRLHAGDPSGEEQRIHESVRQSAPVLANLRNPAVAEIRAATDGLTGLPNKRAATDTLKRMFPSDP